MIAAKGGRHIKTLELHRIRAVFCSSSYERGSCIIAARRISYLVSCITLCITHHVVLVRRPRQRKTLDNHCPQCVSGTDPIYMERFLKGFPINCSSAPFREMLSISNILVYLPLPSFMASRINCASDKLARFLHRRRARLVRHERHRCTLQ